MIKFGDIGYFTLLGLQSKLQFRDYDKLGLSTLDKLRNEIYIKIEQINFEENKRNKSKQ